MSKNLCPVDDDYEKKEKRERDLLIQLSQSRQLSYFLSPSWLYLDQGLLFPWNWDGWTSINVLIMMAVCEEVREGASKWVRKWKVCVVRAMTQVEQSDKTDQYLESSGILGSSHGFCCWFACWWWFRVWWAEGGGGGKPPLDGTPVWMCGRSSQVRRQHSFSSLPDVGGLKDDALKLTCSNIGDINQGDQTVCVLTCTRGRTGRHRKMATRRERTTNDKTNQSCQYDSVTHSITREVDDNNRGSWFWSIILPYLPL